MGPAKKIGWLWSADSQEKLTGEAHSAVSVLAQRALWGSRAQSLSVPHFSDYRKHPSFSLQDLPWVAAGRFSWGREGIARPGRNKLSRAALGQGPVSPATDTPNKYMLVAQSCPTLSHQVPLSMEFSKQEY